MASLCAGLNARRDGFGAGSPAGDGCLSDEVDTLTRISDPRPRISTHTHTGCLKRSWLRGKDWTAKPTEPSFLKAAGYPIPVETGLRILDQMDVQSGQTLLVSGASGGVGLRSPAIRPCSRHPVIDTAGPANQSYLQSLGVAATPYGDGLVERVSALAPHGVDAGFDIAGSGIIPQLIELTGNPT